MFSLFRVRQDSITRWPSTWFMGIAILAVVTAFCTRAARASSDGWYVTAEVGQSHFTDIGTFGSPIYPDSFGKTTTGYGLGAGYVFTRYFGLEGGYVNFGDVAGSAALGIYPVCVPPFCPTLQAFNVNSDLKSYGWRLELVGTIPLEDGWTIYARGGGIEMHTEMNTVTAPCGNCLNPFPSGNLVSGTTRNTSNDFDATYGVGVEWFFTNYWSARLSWDRYTSVGKDIPMGSFNLSLTSIGIVYSF